MIKREMDNLSMCAAEARRLGISYGQYMAKYGGIRGLQDCLDTHKEGYEERHCPVCGKRYYVDRRSNRVYCSDYCYRKMDRLRTIERNRKRREEDRQVAEE